MLIEPSYGVSINDELCNLHHFLTENYTHLNSVPVAIKLLEEIQRDIHTSGYPDPNKLRLAAKFLRNEKFRAVRDCGEKSELAAQLQHVITKLKMIMSLAEKNQTLCPEKKSHWRDREWNSSSCNIPVFPFFILVLHAIIIGVMFLFDMSGVTRILSTGVLTGILLALAVAVKDEACIHLLILLAAMLILTYFFLTECLLNK